MTGFNRKSEDYDQEQSIDLDGDGTVQGPKKQSTRKYPNAPTIRKVFQEVLALAPANWKVNKTQLTSCENLYTERGTEKVRRALKYYKNHKDEEFCPQISSPYDLDSKWQKLLDFKKRVNE